MLLTGLRRNSRGDVVVLDRVQPAAAPVRRFGLGTPSLFSVYSY